MESSNEFKEQPRTCVQCEAAQKWEEIKIKLDLINNVKIKPYSIKELAGIYKVHVSTFKRMLQPYSHLIGPQAGHFYTIGQVKQIFHYIEQPSEYTLKDLAEMYHVCIETFKIWLNKFKDELGEKKGHYFSLRQVFIIVYKLDLPSIEEKEEDNFICKLRTFL